MGTSTWREVTWAGTITGASIEAGPSPTTDAAPVAASYSTEIWVIEKSAATPGGIERIRVREGHLHREPPGVGDRDRRALRVVPGDAGGGRAEADRADRRPLELGLEHGGPGALARPQRLSRSGQLVPLGVPGAARGLIGELLGQGRDRGEGGGGGGRRRAGGRGGARRGGGSRPVGRRRRSRSGGAAGEEQRHRHHGTRETGHGPTLPGPRTDRRHDAPPARGPAAEPVSGPVVDAATR